MLRGIHGGRIKMATAFPLKPVNVDPPTTTENPSVGNETTANNGTWRGRPTPVYTHQWQISLTGVGEWSNIVGATAQSYLVLVGNVGSFLRCVVTATNSIASVSVATAATAEITL